MGGWGGKWGTFTLYVIVAQLYCDHDYIYNAIDRIGSWNHRVLRFKEILLVKGGEF